MIASGLLRLQRSEQHLVESLCHDSPEGFMPLEAIWLEPTTFREMFWLCLRLRASVAVTSLPADFNIYSSHMKIINLAMNFPLHQTLPQ